MLLCTFCGIRDGLQCCTAGGGASCKGVLYACDKNQLSLYYCYYYYVYIYIPRYIHKSPGCTHTARYIKNQRAIVLNRKTNLHNFFFFFFRCARAMRKRTHNMSSSKGFRCCTWSAWGRVRYSAIVRRSVYSLVEGSLKIPSSCVQ